MTLTQVGLERLNTATTDKIGTSKNIVINGAMQVAQRGTSTTTNGYLIDRFTSSLGGIDQMQFTMSQSTDAPSGFRKSLKFDITTAETGGTGSDEYAMVRTITESQDIAHLLYGTSAAKTITLSFHVKAYQTGTYALNLFVGDSGRSYTANYTISQSATWEKKTLTFVGDTGGSEVNVDNGHGLYINWFMAAGTDYKSATTNFNQWAVLGGAQGWAYGHNVDLLNSTDNYFQLAGVQLEVGSVATDFEHRSFADELKRCQRYYEKSYRYEDAVGSTSNTNGNIDQVLGSNQHGSVVYHLRFFEEKRTQPTVTFYRPDTGASGEVQYGRSGNNSDTASVTVDAHSTKSCRVYFGIGAHYYKVAFLQGHYTAEAEL